MKLRKQVYELVPEDLEKFPVWEFALDEEGEEGEDETTVRPSPQKGRVDPTAGALIVKAKFTLASGIVAHGYLTPKQSGISDLGTIHPVVVTDRGQVFFWRGVIAPSKDDISQSYSRLSGRAADIFPIVFESAVPLLGGPVRGSLPGFLVLEDWRTGKVRIVQ